MRTLPAKEKFRDPVWRISNLYSIRTRDGKVIPFRPRPQQVQVLDMIFRLGLKRIVILKARQLGFSTLLGIICTDQLCWTTGKQLSLIDRTQENARQKLRDIVALAYDSLHEELKARFIVSRSNAGEFGVCFHEYNQAQTSTLFAGTHARGGANSFLWISEWGYVQCEDLRRSEEILTGALPSAKDGTIVVETTWRGGRGGHLWDIVKTALETPEERKQPDDWRVVCFPWQDDPAYYDGEPRPLTQETLAYFAGKPGFSLGQMSWYQRAREQYGMFIKREFPTLLEECFQTPIEGASMRRSSTGCVRMERSGPRRWTLPAAVVSNRLPKGKRLSPPPGPASTARPESVCAEVLKGSWTAKMRAAAEHDSSASFYTTGGFSLYLGGQ